MIHSGTSAKMTARTFDQVRSAAVGRWPEILPGLSIDLSALRNRHGPCPGCGGRDRFRFDDMDGRGTFYCGGGGEPKSGDGFALLQHVYGWTAAEALQRVADSLGMDGTRPAPIMQPRQPAKAPEPSRTRGYALELWQAANTADAVVGTHAYATSKGITWAAVAGRGIASGKIIGRNQDCVIVPIRNITGAMIAIQAINPSGKKQTFGSMDDGCLLLGNTLDKSIPWVVVEGWADAVSWVFHLHRGNAVAAVAFGLSRMQKVAQIVASHYAPNRVTIMEDAPND